MQGLLMEKWAKKFRSLVVALIFSGALNIGLLTALIVSSLEKTVLPKEVVHEGERSQQQLLSSMAHLSFRELVSFLTNRQGVEEGYLKRDLALASLVAFHDFHLEKALAGSAIQRRTLTLSPNQQIEVFPGLTEEQFQAVIKFAYEEKWPLTSKGLFRLLKQTPRDESLEQAFLTTPEFYALEQLFQKSGSSQPRLSLVDLVCEGSWELFDRFYKEQGQILDFSQEKRTQLLLSYLAFESPTAARLLVETDFPFALKKLSDPAVLELLRLLDQKTPEVERYCLELLHSPRNGAVLQSAAERLRIMGGEPLPEVLPTYRTHVVQEGENLWKIARQYGLKLEELVQLNELEKEQIFPGMVLRVP